MFQTFQDVFTTAHSPQKGSIMGTSKKKESTGKKLRDELARQVKKELDKSQKSITGLEESIKQLQEKSRPLVSQLEEMENQAHEIERRLMSEERRYSRFMKEKFLLEKATVNISDEEIEDLNRLSRMYKAFRLIIPPDDPDTDELCVLASCWTCSMECALCRGCGMTVYCGSQ